MSTQSIARSRLMADSYPTHALIFTIFEICMFSREFLLFFRYSENDFR